MFKVTFLTTFFSISRQLESDHTGKANLVRKKICPLISVRSLDTRLQHKLISYKTMKIEQKMMIIIII